MSKIQGKPFIELVVDTLGDLKTDFLDLVNGSDKTPEFRSLINASAKITGSDKGKVQYVVLETWSKTYTGYLIYNNTYCVLVAFSSNTQALTMLKIDVAKQTFTTVKEYLDINELRRYLEEADEHVVATEIDSGSAQAGEVLAANGQGGAGWIDVMDAITPETVEEGDAVQLFGFNSQGQLVKDAIPEGITVDQTIIEDSPNAVAGGAVYPLTEDIDALEEEMETKANVDGNYPTMTVGAADNLTPYDEDSGVDQEQPFLLQGTGCGNGEQQVDTGALGLLKEKQGNTVVVNQLVSSVTIGDTVDGIIFTKIDDETLTISGTATARVSRGVNDNTINVEANHYYLIRGMEQNDQNIGLIFNGYGAGGYVATYSGRDTGNGIIILNSNPNVTLLTCELVIENGTALSKTYTVRPKAIDLTQWFGSNDNIPAHLLAHPEDFFRYYQGSLAYNEGELVNSNGRYLKAIGRNQWDEEWEVGDWYLGEKVAGSGNTIRCKNPVKVIPNATYNYYNVGGYSLYTLEFLDKDLGYISRKSLSTGSQFIIPSNCEYVVFTVQSAYGTTYNHDITISLYYEGESGYDQYYPYEELTNNDTGTEVLRSAGNVADIKLPDGTIKRNVGVVDLGTLNWTYTTSYSANCFFTRFNGMKVKAKVLCAKYKRSDANLVYYELDDFSVSTNNSQFDSGPYIFIKDSNYTDAATFKTAMSGVYLFYELAEPTTEQGTSYSENVAIDDFGSMDFGGTNGVPQGASIFYPVDYKAFIDSLYNKCDGAADDIALDSELAEVDNKHDALYGIVKENLGGILRHQLVDENSGLDFENTAYLDLSDENMNWYEATGGFSSGQLPVDTQLPSGERGVLAKILCPKYQVITSDEQYAEIKIGICLGGGGIGSERTIRVCDNRYTLEQFKNAMKGILMAYKKASE